MGQNRGLTPPARQDKDMMDATITSPHPQAEPAAPQRERKPNAVYALIQAVAGLLVPLTLLWLVRPWVLPESEKEVRARSGRLARILLPVVRILLLVPFVIPLLPALLVVLPVVSARGRRAVLLFC